MGCCSWCGLLSVLGFSCIVVNRVNSVGIECVLYAVLRVCFGFACALFIVVILFEVWLLVAVQILVGGVLVILVFYCFLGVIYVFVLV